MWRIESRRERERGEPGAREGERTWSTYLNVGVDLGPLTVYERPTLSFALSPHTVFTTFLGVFLPVPVCSRLLGSSFVPPC